MVSLLMSRDMYESPIVHKDVKKGCRKNHRSYQIEEKCKDNDRASRGQIRPGAEAGFKRLERLAVGWH